MKMVKITKLTGQTGLRRPGSVLGVKDETADHWISNGWAELLNPPNKDKPAAAKKTAVKKKATKKGTTKK